MGENSAIQWTDHTFNGWWGCVRISPGCERCYAETLDKRVGGRVGEDGQKALTFGAHGRRGKTSAKNWQQPVRWNREALAAGRRARVFTASMSDVFEVPRPGGSDLDVWLLELLDLIASTPALDWQVLTKRPATIKARLTAAVDAWARTPGPCELGVELAQSWLDGTPPANVWLGATVEDQQRAHERIPALLAVPAKVRFLSCEPLLERVDLDRAVAVPGGEPCGLKCAKERGRGIDWVIVGGESGPGARPFNVEWARDLVRQCRAAGVAPFVKQLGARPVFAEGDVPDLMWSAYDASGHDREEIHAAAREGRLRFRDPPGGDLAEWPADLRVREFPEVAP